MLIASDKGENAKRRAISLFRMWFVALIPACR